MLRHGRAAGGPARAAGRRGRLPAGSRDLRGADYFEIGAGIAQVRRQRQLRRVDYHRPAAPPALAVASARACAARSRV